MLNKKGYFYRSLAVNIRYLTQKEHKPRLQIQMVALNHFYNIELAPSEFKQLCLVKNLLKLINCHNGSQTTYPYKIGTRLYIENAD